MMMIDTREFAKRLGVHPDSVGRAAKAGKLPGAVRITNNGRGPYWDIPAELLARCLVRISKGGYRRVTWPEGNPKLAEKRPKNEYLALPLCPICGIVLTRDGCPGHPPSGADADMCWACKQEGRELP